MNDATGTLELPAENQRETTMNVIVLYGPNRQEVEVPEGATPQSVMADRFISDLVGYVAGERNVALVNGTRAEWTAPLNANDEVEILKRAGNKA